MGMYFVKDWYCQKKGGKTYQGIWVPKTWNGLTDFNGAYVWTDGTDIYFSYYTTQKVLNKATSTWSDKTWTSYTSFDGRYVWKDGSDTYYSLVNSNTYNYDGYMLNSNRNGWDELGTIVDSFNYNGNQVWTDGDETYVSNGNSGEITNSINRLNFGVKKHGT